MENLNDKIINRFANIYKEYGPWRLWSHFWCCQTDLSITISSQPCRDLETHKRQNSGQVLTWCLLRLKDKDVTKINMIHPLDPSCQISLQTDQFSCCRHILEERLYPSAVPVRANVFVVKKTIMYNVTLCSWIFIFELYSMLPHSKARAFGGRTSCLLPKEKWWLCYASGVSGSCC